MFYHGDDALKRLIELSKTADKIRLASAWATPGKAQYAILSSRAKKYAIIGTSGFSTDPLSLFAFLESSELRTPSQAPLFHSKLIIFSIGKSDILWIGSANLTFSGYEANREVVCELEDDGAAVKWFEEQWENSTVCTEEIIREYEKTRIRNLERAERGLISNSDNSQDAEDFDDLLGKLLYTDDWKSYYELLQQADRFWRKYFSEKNKIGFSVFGDVRSWANTIHAGSLVIGEKNWSNYSARAHNIIMGVEDISNAYGLLGSLNPAGNAKKIFNYRHQEYGEVRNKIRGFIEAVLEADSETFPRIASDFIVNVTSVRGLGIGVASRLLCLARPDLSVSINGGSRERLSRFTSIPVNEYKSSNPINAARSYVKTIEFLQKNLGISVRFLRQDWKHQHAICERRCLTRFYIKKVKVKIWLNSYFLDTSPFQQRHRLHMGRPQELVDRRHRNHAVASGNEDREIARQRRRVAGDGGD